MPKIVIVDDSDLILKILVRQLESAGYTVQAQSKPMNALMAVLRSRPELVLLDVNVPELDGPRFCQSVPGSTRVLLHSSQSDEALRAVAEQWGAHGFIGKSWALEEKLAALASQANVSGT